MCRYEVASYDVCVSGFERLRSYSEFMLVCGVTSATSREDIESELLSDIQACERPDDFDWEGAKALVRDFVASFDMSRVTALDDNKCDDEDQDEYLQGCNLYLYVHDTKDGAHYPVY